MIQCKDCLLSGIARFLKQSLKIHSAAT
jgi:hypothetical protein